MTAHHLSAPSTPAERLSLGKIFRAGLLSVVAAVLANLLVLLLVRAVLPGLPAGFPPLTPPAIITITTLGTALGAVVFAIITRLSRRPVRTYWIVAMLALVLSILPNFGLMANPSAAPFPGGTALAFAALIIFHIVAGLVSTYVLTRLAR